ncbi:MAG: hypothetical protein WC869_16445 [Phycisphaerae bacterium]
MALPLAIVHRHQLLTPVGGGAHQHQHAGAVVGEADVEVHRIRPPVDLALAVQRPLRPGDKLLLPDLLSRRMQARGAAGSISDMGVRDSSRILEVGIPTFSRGPASPGGTVFNVDFNVPIGCAGVLVCPGDIVSADDDGVVVVPQGLLPEVLEEVLLHEDREDFIRQKLAQGESLHGLYPMGPEWEDRFRQWRREELGR